ncbi:hypothetical protein I3843_08G161900 [Carya illinoinensis]|uniref:Uncharacterized protein n=1 Tax=Carya illinoinensis TaxID=32201 RepID=A0A922JAY6_CARIL|nr:hypothetical protein I3842_08G167900 [Carya illinoinensis]KAG7968588.1 hypothetical protein I3843_08G161900 [Carya illinoinensis]
MDQREHQMQSLSICQRLFYFILKSFASQAFKIVTLGPPLNPGSPQVPISSAAHDGAGSKSDHPTAQGRRPCEAALSGAKAELEQGNASGNLGPFGPHGREFPPVQDVVSSVNSGKRSEKEEEGMSSAAVAQPKAPKKMVSTNDLVEEISTPKKNKKMNKNTKNLTSLEREEDDPKPLRSIEGGV